MISTLSPYTASTATDVMSFSIFMFTIAFLVIFLSLKILLKSESQNKSVKKFLGGINMLLLPLQIIFILFVIERIVALI